MLDRVSITEPLLPKVFIFIPLIGALCQQLGRNQRFYVCFVADTHQVFNGVSSVWKNNNKARQNLG